MAPRAPRQWAQSPGRAGSGTPSIAALSRRSGTGEQLIEVVQAGADVRCGPEATDPIAASLDQLQVGSGEGYLVQPLAILARWTAAALWLNARSCRWRDGGARARGFG